MDRKKEIKEELRSLLFELQMCKFDEQKKIELKNKQKELEKEYKTILLDELQKTK